MVNFWNCVWGFLLFVISIICIIRTTKNRNKKIKDTYGNYIDIYFGEIGLAFIGLIMFLKEIFKLL